MEEKDIGRTGEIINECDEISMISPRRRGERSTNISMNKLKQICTPFRLKFSQFD